MIEGRVRALFEQIEEVTRRSGRPPGCVKLVAATKGRGVDEVNSYIDCVNSIGQRALIGESYLNELREKLPELVGDFELHFIGRLQSNKVKDVASLSRLIHSVGHMSVLRELQKSQVKNSSASDFLLQVNISNDPSKDGFTVDEILNFSSEWSRWPRQPYGLMAMTAFDELLTETRQHFVSLRDLARQVGLFESLQGGLSMGMSRDFKVAIEEGADFIRVGSAIFEEG